MEKFAFAQCKWALRFNCIEELRFGYEFLVCYRPQRSWGKDIFSQVCVILFTGGDACSQGSPRGVPAPGRGVWSGGGVLQAHTQGGNWGGSGPGPHPRGKLRGIRSRPTPKGEIDGDQIQAHTQRGNWGGSDPGPHPRGKLRGIRSSPPPLRRPLLRAVCILLECILVSHI